MNEDSPHIRKIARIHDEATREFVEMIQFTTLAGEVSSLVLAPSTVADPRLLIKSLRDKGAALPKLKPELANLAETIAAEDAPVEQVYAACTGWTAPSVFVMHDRAISPDETSVIGLSPTRKPVGNVGLLSSKGTAGSWRRSVGKLALMSSLSMCAVCTALAAPLLKLIGWQSFGICASGISRSGKSLNLLCGASLIGIPTLEAMPSWNTTPAALEQLASHYNDLPFAIEDLESLKANDRKKYMTVRGASYSLTQGSATARHKSFLEAHGTTQETWRTIFFTSHERSIAELARRVGMDRQLGESARLIDIPIGNENLGLIFDRVPADLTRNQDWRSSQFRAIARACQSNHGQVFDEYILALIRKSFGLRQSIERDVEAFVGKVCDDLDSQIARDVARKFGLIYAGGMLGTKTGVIDWDQSDIFNSIERCYRAARDLLPDEGISLRLGLTALKAGLNSLPTQLAWDNKPAKQGFRNPWHSRYIISCIAFNQLFRSRTQRQLVLDRLIAEGAISLALCDEDKGTDHRIPQGQFIWPDGKRRRSYCIRWKDSLIGGAP